MGCRYLLCFLGCEVSLAGGAILAKVVDAMRAWTALGSTGADGYEKDTGNENMREIRKKVEDLEA